MSYEKEYEVIECDIKMLSYLKLQEQLDNMFLKYNDLNIFL